MCFYVQSIEGSAGGLKSSGKDTSTLMGSVVVNGGPHGRADKSAVS